MTWHDVDDRLLLAFAVAAGPHTLSLAALIAEFARTIAARDDPRVANAIAGTDCLESILHDPELLPGIRAAGPYSDPVEELLRRHTERVITSDEAAGRAVLSS
jgi:hypothetical protein